MRFWQLAAEWLLLVASDRVGWRLELAMKVGLWWSLQLEATLLGFAQTVARRATGQSCVRLEARLESSRAANEGWSWCLCPFCGC